MIKLRRMREMKRGKETFLKRKNGKKIRYKNTYSFVSRVILYIHVNVGGEQPGRG